MCSWKKQAVPLVFLEISLDSIKKSIKETGGSGLDILILINKIFKKIDTAWEPLRKNKRIDDSKAQKIVVNSAKNIQDGLKNIWTDGGIKFITELPSAMLAIAEDILHQLPKTDQSRISAWEGLVESLYELMQIVDPELSDYDGGNRGIQIAEIVLKQSL